MWPELALALYRGRGAVLAAALLGAVVALVMSLVTPPSFRSEAALVRRDPVRIADAEVDPAREPALVGQETVLRTALERVSPPEGPGGLGGWLSRLWNLPSAIDRSWHGFPDTPAAELAVRRSLRVDRDEATGRVAVRVESPDPEYSAAVANAILDVHLARVGEVGASDPPGAPAPATVSTTDLREAWTRAVEAMRTDLETWLGGPHVDADLDALRERLVAAEGAVDEARAELDALRARADSVAGADVRKPARGPAGPEGTVTPSVGGDVAAVGATSDAAAATPTDVPIDGAGPHASDPLQERLGELEMERAQLLARYKPGSVAVRAVDRQIREVRAMLDARQSRAASRPRIVPADVEAMRLELESIRAEAEAARADLDRARVDLARIEEDRSVDDRGIREALFAAELRLAESVVREREGVAAALRDRIAVAERRGKERETAATLIERARAALVLQEAAAPTLKPERPAASGADVERAVAVAQPVSRLHGAWTFLGALLGALAAAVGVVWQDRTGRAVQSGYEAVRRTDLALLGETRPVPRGASAPETEALPSRARRSPSNGGASG